MVMKTGRSIQRRVPKAEANRPTIDLVVARHQEDVGWVKELLGDEVRDALSRYKLRKIFVYNKGDKGALDGLFDGHEVVVVKDLPNVGRESHTYLHHMLFGYGDDKDKPDKIAFAQAQWSDHLSAHDFDMLVSSGEVCGVGILDLQWSENVMTHFRWSEDGNYTNGVPMKASRETIGGYALRTGLLMTLPPRHMTRWCHNGFAVATPAQIEKKKEALLRAYESVSDHMNPMFGHYLERLWVMALNEED